MKHIEYVSGNIINENKKYKKSLAGEELMRELTDINFVMEIHQLDAIYDSVDEWLHIYGAIPAYDLILLLDHMCCRSLSSEFDIHNHDLCKYCWSSMENWNFAFSNPGPHVEMKLSFPDIINE